MSLEAIYILHPTFFCTRALKICHYNRIVHSRESLYSITLQSQATDDDATFPLRDNMTMPGEFHVLQALLVTAIPLLKVSLYWNRQSNKCHGNRWGLYHQYKYGQCTLEISYRQVSQMYPNNILLYPMSRQLVGKVLSESFGEFQWPVGCYCS